MSLITCSRRRHSPSERSVQPSLLAGRRPLAATANVTRFAACTNLLSATGHHLSRQIKRRVLVGDYCMHLVPETRFGAYNKLEWLEKQWTCSIICAPGFPRHSRYSH